MKKLLLPLIASVLLVGCGESTEDWKCVTKNETMFSMNKETGAIGGAGKGCSCMQIAAFEQKVFGEIDEQALRDDFGCE